LVFARGAHFGSGTIPQEEFSGVEEVVEK